MKACTNDRKKPYSHRNDDDTSHLEDSEQLNMSCRKLTSSDVVQALNTLNVVENLDQQIILEADTQLPTVDTNQPEHDCCRLRRLHNTSRLSLPLARRGRSIFSKAPRLSLCSNCTKLKLEQEIDILQHEQEKSNLHDKYHITINLDASSDNSITSSDNKYQSSQALIWNMNSPVEISSNMSYDTGSLNETEKKLILDETIRKIQCILNNPPSSNIVETDQQNPDVTRRILHATINILSSSQNSM